jgi:hypothetical protein
MGTPNRRRAAKSSLANDGHGESQASKLIAILGASEDLRQILEAASWGYTEFLVLLHRHRSELPADLLELVIQDLPANCGVRVPPDMAAEPRVRRRVNGTRVNNLVVQGTGYSCLALAGALTELQRIGLLTDLRHVSGLSTGSVMAVMLAVGYEARAIELVMEELDESVDRKGVPRRGLGAVLQLSSHAISADGVLSKWLQSLIRIAMQSLSDTLGVSCPSGVIDFKSLYEWQQFVARKGMQLPELILNAASVDGPRFVSFGRDYTPRLPVHLAAAACQRTALAKGPLPRGPQRQLHQVIDGMYAGVDSLRAFDHIDFLEDPGNGVAVDYYSERDVVWNRETLGLRVQYSVDRREEVLARVGRLPRNSELLDHARELDALAQMVAWQQAPHAPDRPRTIVVDVTSALVPDVQFGSRRLGSRLVECGVRSVQAFVARSSDGYGGGGGEEIDKLGESIVAYLAENPGRSVEQIGQALGARTKSLAPLIIRMIEQNRLKTTGQRRGTRYFAR